MDFLTLLTYVLAIIETGALIMALVYITRAMHEKKANKDKKQQSPARKTYYKKSLIFVFVYLILNVIRNTGLLG